MIVKFRLRKSNKIVFVAVILASITGVLIPYIDVWLAFAICIICAILVDFFV